MQKGLRLRADKSFSVITTNGASYILSSKTYGILVRNVVRVVAVVAVAAGRGTQLGRRVRAEEGVPMQEDTSLRRLPSYLFSRSGWIRRRPRG